MTLLKSSDYDGLAGVSSQSQSYIPKRFFSVFITGSAREGQTVGKFQCMLDLDKGEYILHDVDNVLFIPCYIKKYWKKTVPEVSASGNKYDKVVAFGWGDDVPKLDNECKYGYRIAGLLLDSSRQSIKHTVDRPDDNIKAGDPIMCHFKCEGMRTNSAIKLLNAITEATKDLPPLSDNKDFERNIVAPRRVICNVKKIFAKSDYGDKMVFEFSVDKTLPDNMVAQVMQKSKDYLEDFDRQFDKSATVNNGTANNPPQTSTYAAPSVSGATDEVVGGMPESNILEGNDFSLGI